MFLLMWSLILSAPHCLPCAMYTSLYTPQISKQPVTAYAKMGIIYAGGGCSLPILSLFSIGPNGGNVTIQHWDFYWTSSLPSYWCIGWNVKKHFYMKHLSNLFSWSFTSWNAFPAIAKKKNIPRHNILIYLISSIWHYIGSDKLCLL